MSEWQPIETAPKDKRRIMLFLSSGVTVFGRWDDDKYAKKPRPYWTNDNEHLFGKVSTRENPPTHWKKLPEPPK